MFADLGQESLDALASMVQVRRYPKGAFIVGQRDTGACMYLLTAGRAKVSLASEEGRELVLDYLEAPAHFGEMSLVDARPRSADVIAVTDVEVLAIDGKDLSMAIRIQPKLALSLIATLSRRLRTMIGRLEDMAFHDARHRVMRVIMNVATANLEARGVAEIRGMTHYDIATLAGTSRETASRIISSLVRSETITTRGRTLIIDLPKLTQELRRD